MNGLQDTINSKDAKKKAIREQNQIIINICFNFLEEILKDKSYNIQDINDILKFSMEWMPVIQSAKIIRYKYYLWNLQRLSNDLRNELEIWLCKQQCGGYEVDRLTQILNNQIQGKNEVDKNHSKVWQSNKLVISRLRIIPYSFALNKNATVLFYGLSGQIQISGLYSTSKQLKMLKFPMGNVTNLLFMKKSNFLLSGSEDSTIHIWNENWLPYQQLVGHKKDITCVVTNEEENLIISSSADKAIKFWNQSNLLWSCNQTLHIKIFPEGLNLNLQSTRLISYGFKKQKNIKIYYIFIIELTMNKWIVTQKILGEYKQPVCFISNNQFVFRSVNLGILEKYYYNNTKKQFLRTKPMIFTKQAYNNLNNVQFKFIEEKNILVVGLGFEIYFLRLLENGEFELFEQIQVENCWYEGFTSDNGQYILIRGKWECENPRVQLLKLRNTNV